MDATQDQLHAQVKRSTNFAVAVFLIVVASYLLWFAVYKQRAPSDDPALWGQMGDYVGGILNPLIAFLAFYWLTKSVLLQRQELQETKAALKESAASQAKQERHAACAARISALSSMLTSANADVAAIRSRLEFLETPMQRPPSSDDNVFDRFWVRRTIGSAEEIEVAQTSHNLLLERRNSLIYKIEAELGQLEDARVESHDQV
ncbi:hypothetical protein PRJ39_25190 [Lysobacter enzymogenes]|uniref:hypothetical protein n=1 Tax=Lysobacter enzymogenes TaxID=69 RepID=UPI0037493745